MLVVIGVNRRGAYPTRITADEVEHSVNPFRFYLGTDDLITQAI